MLFPEGTSTKCPTICNTEDTPQHVTSAKRGNLERLIRGGASKELLRVRKKIVNNSGFAYRGSHVPVGSKLSFGLLRLLLFVQRWDYNFLNMKSIQHEVAASIA